MSEVTMLGVSIVVFALVFYGTYLLLRGKDPKE